MFLFCVIRFTQKITYIYKRNYPPLRQLRD